MSKINNKTNGITLISLIVTIVVLLILAGVTIASVLGNNSIINRAQEAKNEVAVATFKEKLNMATIEAYTQKGINGSITAEEFFEILKNHGIISDVTVPGKNIATPETDENGNKIYNVNSDDGYAFEVIIDKDGNIETNYLGPAGELPPRVRSIKVTNRSTNNIEVKVTVGNLENGKLSYYYKKNTESKYKELKANVTDLTANFTGLEQNVIYNIKVKVENSKGSHELEISEITGSLITGTITQKGELVWNPTDHTATIELQNSQTEYKMQYQINGTSGQWLDYTGPITGLKCGDKIMAVIFDGLNRSEETIITIIDGIAPNVTVTKGTVTTSSISVNVTSKDDQSGMSASPTYNYYIKKSTEGTYPTKASYTGTDTSYTFTGLLQSTSYDVKVVTVDNANNTGIGNLLNTTTEKVGGATGDLTTGNVTAGQVTWNPSTHKASVTLSTTTTLSIQYKVGSSGKWTPASGTSTTAGKPVTVSGLNHNDIVYARLIDTAGNYGSEAFLTILDETAPTVTVSKGTVDTSSIQVSVTSKDDQSGMVASPTYNYYIKKSAEGSYPQSANYTGANTSYTFTGLTQNTSYDIKVTTVDNANNTGTGTATNIKTTTVEGTTGGLQTGNITAGMVTWNKSNHKASVVLSTKTNKTIQYKIGAGGTYTPTSGSTVTAGQDVTVTNLNHNDIVYARLVDTAGNTGSEAFLTVLDGTVPVMPSINLNSTSVNTGATLTATVNHTDDQSGVNTANSKYIWNTTSGKLGTTNASWNSASSFTSNPQTITLSTSNPGTYYLHVLTTDNGGNKSESVSSAVTIKQLVTGITLDKTNATMTEGSTLQLTATVNPGNASNKTLKWTTSNQTYATVGTNGLVTAKAAGNVTITATAQDGSGKSAACSIIIQSAGTSADDVVKTPSKYYGKTVTGYTCANSSAVANWKIYYAGKDFSADGKNHIYLIADDYVARNYLPKSSAGHALNAGNSSYPKAAYFTNILNDYTGSASITNANVKKLNNSYFSQNFTSTNNNMKSVAYMCDTNAWSVYKGAKADYAVGGPSVEMLMKAYSQAYGVDYRAKALNATGYQISMDGGATWYNYMQNSSQYLKTDSVYVISSNSNAYGQWLASPSAGGSSRLMYVYYDGYVDWYSYNYSIVGFRPLVCLSSDVKLQDSGNGTFAIK